MNFQHRPRRIAIVGGTHGNEKSGVWVVRAMRDQPDRFRRPGIQVRPLLANVEAERSNLRFLDRDLNRCFGPELRNLTDCAPDSREAGRAAEIKSELEGTDLVIDVHNTTAAMGLTWILTDASPWVWWLASEAVRANPRVRILYTPETKASNVFLPSLGKTEITLEIGPVPHGTHSHWAAEAAIAHVEFILDTLSAAPDSFEPRVSLEAASFEYFLGLSSCDYPRASDGSVTATIHKDFTGRDYLPLTDGAPIFHDPVHDMTIVYRGETIHPVFIGEAAYVEKGIAYTPTLLRSWDGGREVIR